MTKLANERYVASLRVVDDAGKPAVGLNVRGFDQDRGRAPDALGEAVTDADGRASISFTGAAAGGASEGAPEFFVMIDGPTGLVHQTKPISLAPGEHELAEIRLQPRPGAAQPSASGTGAGAASPAPAPADPSTVPGENRIHGSASRGVIVPRSSFHHGPFGRLFRKLPAWTPPGGDDAAKETAIRAIADLMVEPAGQPDAPAGDNGKIPVGYTYFGQFVDHDITFDPTSSLVRLNDPDRLINFRTPRFDLDNLYGEGPDDEPFLYDQRPDHAGEFLLGRGPSAQEADLPRNEQETALIGDPRNDENIIVAQLQLAFLKLHNHVLARVKSEEGLTGREAFLRAQTLVRWHYQWVVLFDFVPRICGDAAARALGQPRDGTAIAPDLRFYKFRDAPFMPVEFSAAAYRYGHSQVRERYNLNSRVTGIPIFLPPAQNPGVLADLRGFRRLPAMWTLDWRLFLPVEDALVPQASRQIDSRLSRALMSIPAGPDPRRGASLAALNLLRGFRLGLPSGQSVARAMGEAPLDNGTLGLDPAVAGTEAPLWYYILKEAEITAGGAHLGPVGGTIVAETFVGLASADPNGFISAEPGWRPSTAFRNGPPLDPSGDKLGLAGLLRAAGVAHDPFQP